MTNKETLNLESLTVKEKHILMSVCVREQIHILDYNKTFERNFHKFKHVCTVVVKKCDVTCQIQNRTDKTETLIM